MPPLSQTRTLPREEPSAAYERSEQMVQRLRSIVPSCVQLDAGVIKLVDGGTIKDNLSGKVQEATHDNRKVALKSYRLFTSYGSDPPAAVRSNHNLCRVVHR